MLTVDIAHSRRMAELTRERGEGLNEKKVRLAAAQAAGATDVDPYSRMVHEDTIRELKNDIATAERGNKMFDYFFDTGDLLFEHYASQERIIAGGHAKRPNSGAHVSGNSIMSYFKKPATIPTTAPSTPDLTRDQIIERFMFAANPDAVGIVAAPIKNENQECCDYCGSKVVIYPSESLMVCTNPQCAAEESILIEYEKPSYKEPPREQSCFPYKRINHFNEWLAQFQAKESTDIPADVYERIEAELRKERISAKAVTNNHIREILRRLGLPKYYEHTTHIIYRLNGVLAPTLTREQEERLRHMFREIQPAFIKHCPPERKNFLSYSYCLRQLCTLLGMDEFARHFPLLKSPEKLFDQDRLWKKICRELEWEFIPAAACLSCADTYLGEPEK